MFQDRKSSFSGDEESLTIIDLRRTERDAFSQLLQFRSHLLTSPSHRPLDELRSKTSGGKYQMASARTIIACDVGRYHAETVGGNRQIASAGALITVYSTVSDASSIDNRQSSRRLTRSHYLQLAPDAAETFARLGASLAADNKQAESARER